jgi:dynein heavy chain
MRIPLLTRLQELRAKAELMERRLIAAERLIAGLASEKERWAADIRTLEAAKVQLVGDCLLCSSFLSYTGMRMAVMLV